MLVYIITQEDIYSSVVVLESEVKFLCNNHQVCSEVMKILQSMGFTHIRDIQDSSTSFDISAKHNFNDGQDREKTIEKVFAKCEGKIHQIQTTTKGSRFF